jgi:signal peptide peptidase SppA
MTTPNPFLARINGEPLLVEATSAERVRSCLEGVVSHEAASIVLNTPTMTTSGDAFWTELPDRWAAILRPYVVQDGILQIPVKGMLLHDFPYALFDLATGYIYIQKAFERGMSDGNVKGIALIIDSPGGMVSGCFDAIDKMLAAKSKPVRAFAHESAYSAAYAIAMVADHIAVSRTGGVGSVGVVTMHVDQSEQLKARGLKVTFIFAGKHKVDGNSTEPLSDEVKARIQARIDESYAVFVSAVARGRGMEEQAVRDTEALTYTATQAVSVGFADSIGSLDDAVAAYAAFLDDQSDNSGEEDMAEANTSAVDQAAVDTARAEGQSAGRSEGVTAERARIAAILGSDEAKGKSALANHIAMNTEMSVDDAKAMLAAAATEAAPAPAKGEGDEANGNTGFTGAMETTGNPNVGGGNGGDQEQQAAEDGSDVRALAASVGLKGFTAQK